MCLLHWFHILQVTTFCCSIYERYPLQIRILCYLAGCCDESFYLWILQLVSRCFAFLEISKTFRFLSLKVRYMSCFWKLILCYLFYHNYFVFYLNFQVYLHFSRLSGNLGFFYCFYCEIWLYGFLSFAIIHSYYF